MAPAGRGLTGVQQRRRTVYSGLAAAGFTETLSYPFYSEEANELFGRAEAGEESLPMVRLANPIAGQHPALRTTILPGLLDTLRRNVSRGFHDLALFEAGSVFLPGETLGTESIPGLGAYPGDEVIARINAGLPDQPLHLAAVLSGAESLTSSGERPSSGLADAVEAARKVADLLSVELEVSQAPIRPSTRVAPQCSPWTAASSGMPGSCIPRWPSPGICRSGPQRWSSTSLR